jgi:hypothetical protein
MVGRLLIAMVAHAVIRAYRLATGIPGDMGGPPFQAWQETPQEYKDQVVAGVEQYLGNPKASARDLHEEWVASKRLEGWIHGEVLDEELKLHPLMVPYASLPEETRTKDQLFQATVLAMAELPEQSAKVVDSSVVPVKYIGQRLRYTDGLYKTGLTWEKGQTLPVPKAKAAQLLNHPDQYVLGDMAEMPTDTATSRQTAGDDIPLQHEEPALSEKEQSEQDEMDADRLTDAEQSVRNMTDTATVRDFVFKNFSGQKMSHNIGIEKAKEKAINLIHQFGIPG